MHILGPTIRKKADAIILSEKIADCSFEFPFTFPDSAITMATGGMTLLFSQNDKFYAWSTGPGWSDQEFTEIHDMPDYIWSKRKDINEALRRRV
jgi:hypothetical protein